MFYKYLVVSKGRLAKLYIDDRYSAINETLLMPLSNEFDDYLKQKFGFRVVYKEYANEVYVLTVLAEKEDWSIKWMKLESYLPKLDDDLGLMDLKQLLLNKIPKSHELLYGIRGEQVVHAVNLDESEWGVKCNCVCPGCGAKLVAKLGSGKENGRIKHFAHEKGQGASCNTNRAQQKAIHLLAKEIIARRGIVMFPPVNIPLSETKVFLNLTPAQREQYGNKLKTDQEIILDAKKIVFDHVELEKTVSNFVPDIVVSKDDKECYIEIAVTHFVDYEKEKKIREQGKSLLEIDLSCFAEEELSEELLTKMIEETTANKKWIYNVKWANPSDLIESKAREKCDQYLSEYLEHERIQLARENKQKKEEEWRKIKEEKRAQAPILLAKTFEPDNYRQLLLTTRNDERFFAIYKELNMYKDCPRAPFYVDIPISGEFIFDCDRRIWQSMLFDKFVFYRQSTDLLYKRIEKWVTEHQDAFRIRWDYSYKCNVNGVQRHLLHDTLSKYLFYLDCLGFIRYYDFGEGTVMAKHIVDPPERIFAVRLQQAIAEVDNYDPNVDNLILQTIRSKYLSENSN